MKASVLLFVMGILLSTAPSFLDQGMLLLWAEILVVIALAQAWNLMAGHSGLLSLGHHGFFGIGAYALFVMTRDLPLNLYLAVPLAGAVAATAALVLAPLLFRLRNVYFAVGMWVAAEIFHILVLRIDWLGGVNGLPLYAARSLDRAWIAPSAYWMALTLAVGLTLLAAALTSGSFGLRLRALRDDETAARSIGVGAKRVRLIVFLVSAAGAGMAGAVHFFSVLFLTPSAGFDINWTVSIVFVTMIGGMGRLSGPFLGAVVFFFLREILVQSPGWHFVILGATAITVMLISPGGLSGMAGRIWQWAAR